MLRLSSFARSSRRSAAALTPLLIFLAACSAAPPAAPPACPTVPAAASTPAPTAPAKAAASVSARAAAPGRMQPPQDAAAAGVCSSDELRAAHDEVDAIAKLIRALPQDMSPADAVTGRMEKLHASRCCGRGYLSANLDLTELKAARAWTVAKWWDRGGYSFFLDALDHANAVHFAPSFPPVIAAELLSAKDPLRAIVCATSGAVCDPPAQGSALDLGREVERMTALRGDASPAGAPGTLEACVSAQSTGPNAGSLFEYVICVDRLVPRRTVLPDARYRSPKGWLMLRGRRGHHNFCDEARAYDLETGTAYIASRCSGLVLGGNGVVDQDATRKAGSVKTQVGTLSVDALRRLALALWLKGEQKENIRPYAMFPLPVGVPMPTPDEGMGFGGLALGSAGGHSGQTRMSFEVVDGTTTVIDGDFLWPDSSDNGEQIIDDLVVSAETTLQQGCPQVPLPVALAPAASLGGVSKLDASADALRANADDLSVALAGLRKIKVCKKK